MHVGIKPIARASIVTLIVSLAFGCSSGGFGMSAGPFEFVLETDESEDDFVITLSNVVNRGGSHGLVNPGGTYSFATHGKSNTVIRFPRAPLYDLTLAGRKSIGGGIYHPKYLTVSVGFIPNDKGLIDVVVGDYFFGHREHAAEPGKPIRVRVKMTPIEEVLAHACDDLEKVQWHSGLKVADLKSLNEKKKCDARRADVWMWVSHTGEYRYFHELERFEEIRKRYLPFYEKYDEKYSEYIKQLYGDKFRFRSLYTSEKKFVTDDYKYKIIKQD